MTEAEQKAVNFYNDAESTISYLAQRWSDEKEYENIDDYKKPLEEMAEKSGVKIQKMIKKPFGCLFSVENQEFQLSLSPAGKYKVSRKLAK